MFERKRTIHLLILLFIFILLGVALPLKTDARPASPAIYILSQPDGLTFEARQWGDETSHGWETLEGYTIVLDEAQNRWTHAVLGPEGRLESSWRVVGKDLPPLEVPKHLRPVIQRIFSGLSVNESGAFGRRSPRRVVSPGGTGQVPVILINFNNTSTTFTSGEFSTLLFGMGNFSMRDYYEEVSYGVFSVTGEVVGWYTASKTHDYYGANDFWGEDKWPGDLVYEAVAAADAAGFNFAAYDTDGDCYVDIIGIIHQGNDEADTGNSTDIWSHQWTLSDAKSTGYSHNGEYTTNDPCSKGGFIKINDYVILPEKSPDGSIATMGGFAHEYGHALGLPDLYDTDYSSEGVGFWSLMAAGSYNGVLKDGDRPAHLDAWCKYYLGWVTPTQVTETLTNEPINQAATTADAYQLGSGTPTSGEYFLVENRQKMGFDAGLPESGLLIWHIDGNIISNRIVSNSVNDSECHPGGPSCKKQHYGVALVQADGKWGLEKGDDLGDEGDPYPGSTNKRSFTNSTSPNSKFYNGSASGVSVTDISDSAETMSATLSFSASPPPSGTLTVTVPNGGEIWKAGTTQTIRWTYTGDPGSNVKIEILKGGNIKVITSSTSIGSGGNGSFQLNIPSKAPLGDDYKIRITSTTDSSFTDTSDINFTIAKKS